MRRRKTAQHGFTLIELMLGLMITALVLTALGGIAAAVSTQWAASDATEALQLQTIVVQQRLWRIFDSARFVGYVSQGSLDGSAAVPAEVFFWAADDFNGAADGIPEIGEMQLLTYDPATQSIYLYAVSANLTPAQQAAAGTVMTFAEMSQASAPANFTALPYVTRTCLCGPGASAASADHPLVTGLRADMLDQTDPTTSQRVCTTLEFQLGLARGGLSTTAYVTCTLRAPATQPS